ncbi:hypothetical protein D9758_008974 [Tetrapyrgos nigripes]|uniref:CFEM domain-containing protein n=1 Tax=Tetrapyrgos nigripes TaxID=182062 RepID=A0A8H5GKX3_9AGAR|nr:hypothetical protein D9758_008974 [Tetrapyrgos nigripes]
MRFTGLFLSAALISLTSASSVSRRQSGLPDCAFTCISTADTGNCVRSDNDCLCRNQAFIDSTTQCIESSCSGNDLQAALSGAQQLCALVGVTLTSTPTLSATDTSSSASSTGTSPATTTESAGSSSTSDNSSNGALSTGVNLCAGIISAAFVALVV